MLDVFTHYSYIRVLTCKGNFPEIIFVYALFLCNDAVEIHNVPFAGRHLQTTLRRNINDTSVNW